MDGSRFDTWTRRRVGLAAGGLAVSLLGAVGLRDAEAKKRRRCKKLAQHCTPNGKRKCCGKRVCNRREGTNGTSCCKKLGASCVLGECCSFETGSGCVGGVCILI